MSEVKWIKISTGMFDDEKIHLIEAMPEADGILVIWIKLLTLAGRKNEHGEIFFNEEIPYTEEMLGTIFNRKLNLIRLALGVFKKFEMVSIDEDKKIVITNWAKHQSADALDKIREHGRLRTQKYREKRLECNVTVTPPLTLPQRSVTPLEEEKEVEEEKETKIKRLPNSPETLRIAALFSRRPTTGFSETEYRKLKSVQPLDSVELDLLERYYTAERKKGDNGIHRRDLTTFLNNYRGEVDRAVAWSQNGTNGSTPKGFFRDVNNKLCKSQA